MGNQKESFKKAYVAMLVLATVVSIAATVLAVAVTVIVINMKKPIDPANKTSMAGGLNKIWTIAVGHDWGAYEYLDENGYLKGFNSEFVRAVCAEAGMDCRLVRDCYTNCYDSKAGQYPLGGKGLHDHRYDACTGWAKTEDRSDVFDFSDPYLEIQPSIFLVKKGNAALFNGTCLKDKKIVFLDGWAHNEQCLGRHEDSQHQNYKLPTENIIHVSSPISAVKLLNNGSAYALFADRMTMLKYKDVEPILDMEFKCVMSGNAMMTRKDSHFNFYFNYGFHKLRKTGKFVELCKKAEAEHETQGKMACLEYHGYPTVVIRRKND